MRFIRFGSLSGGLFPMVAAASMLLAGCGFEESDPSSEDGEGGDENIGTVSEALSSTGVTAADAYLDSWQPFYNYGDMYGRGEWAPFKVLKNGYRQLQVCLQYYSNGWRNANCQYSGNIYLIDGGWQEYAIAHTVTSSTKTCWRTWSWYYTTYNYSTKTAVSPSTCNYKKPG